MKNVGASERRMCLLACRGEYQGPWRPRAANTHREPAALDRLEFMDVRVRGVWRRGVWRLAIELEPHEPQWCHERSRRAETMADPYPPTRRRPVAECRNPATGCDAVRFEGWLSVSSRVRAGVPLERPRPAWFRRACFHRACFHRACFHRAWFHRAWFHRVWSYVEMVAEERTRTCRRFAGACPRRLRDPSRDPSLDPTSRDPTSRDPTSRDPTSPDPGGKEKL